MRTFGYPAMAGGALSLLLAPIMVVIKYMTGWAVVPEPFWVDAAEGALGPLLRFAPTPELWTAYGTIYTVALVDPIDRHNNPKLLKQLAEATGGEAFKPRSIDDVADVLEHIARDIRHTYTIGYVSSNAARDGTYRPIRLVVQPPPGTSVQVRTRAGYVGCGSRGGSPMRVRFEARASWTASNC